MTSKVLDTMISKLLAEDPAGGGVKAKGLPVLSLTEEGNILSLLLRLCYPIYDPSIATAQWDLGDLSDVLKAATKYEMSSPIETCKQMLRKHALENPLKVYFIAVGCGLKEEARYAAIRMIPLLIEDLYTSEMEYMHAEVYHPLLQFQHLYRQTICDLVSSPDRNDVFNNFSNSNWVWKEDNVDIHSELVFSIVAQLSARVVYGYQSGHPQKNLSGRMAESFSLKNQICNKLSKIPLEVPWPVILPPARAASPAESYPEHEDFDAPRAFSMQLAIALTG